MGGSKPKSFYQVRAKIDQTSKEFFAELTPMVAYAIANTQKMATDIGATDALLYAIKYRVKKLGNVRPFWDIVPIMPEGTPVPKPQEPPKGVVNLDSVAVVAPVEMEKLTNEEVEYLKRFESFRVHRRHTQEETRMDTR
jgi:hypothetical protein